MTLSLAHAAASVAVPSSLVKVLPVAALVLGKSPLQNLSNRSRGRNHEPGNSLGTGVAVSCQSILTVEGSQSENTELLCQPFPAGNRRHESGGDHSRRSVAESSDLVSRCRLMLLNPCFFPSFQVLDGSPHRQKPSVHGLGKAPEAVNSPTGDSHSGSDCCSSEFGLHRFMGD